MNKTVATILLVAGIALGLFGYSKYDKSVETINVVGLEFSAKDESGVKEGYLFMGAGILLAIGGLVGLAKS